VIDFGTLHENGTYESRGQLSPDAIRKCPHVIFDFDHYRPDGTCKCNDPAEQARLIAEYDYTPEDFK
jgi:hypothetical protein